MSKKKLVKKILIRTTIILILLPLILIIGVFIYFMSKPKLDAELRQEIGGQYITLSKGVTHYELIQPTDSAPLIVLIPGLTVPKAVYMNNVEALQKAGYATLRYDFYGRGLSDRPFMKYNYKVYAAQTKELLDSLKIDKPVHLLGISLGAAIGAEIIADEPERYKSITFVGAAVSFSKAAADAKKRAVLMDRLRVFKKNDFVDTTLDAYKFIPYIKEQFKYRGAELAFISLAMNESVFDYLASYKKLTNVKEIPMQIIWGELDDNFPHSLGVRLSKMFPEADFLTISGGGHTPHFGQADQVNPLLVKFLDRVEGRADNSNLSTIWGQWDAKDSIIAGKISGSNAIVENLKISYVFDSLSQLTIFENDSNVFNNFFTLSNSAIIIENDTSRIKLYTDTMELYGSGKHKNEGFLLVRNSSK